MGGRVAEVADKLGQPLMPWQRYVADVALELDPVTMRLAYRQVVILVPRQSGKTTLLLSVMVHRALGFGGHQVIIYTAQNKLKAREKWEDEHVPLLQASPYKKMFRLRLRNGSEAILWRNGSRHGPVPTTEKSGHGSTLDLPVIDEAWSQSDGRVEQSFKPAMVTRPQAQLWVPSTAGWKDESPYLEGKVTAGRAAVEAGTTRGVAYFEWSAPDDADPADPAVWEACMPALGHTIELDTIAADYVATEDKDEFRRAYLNQWRRRPLGVPAIFAPDDWAANLDAASLCGDPVAIAIDTTQDRAWTSISIVGFRDDGETHAEVIDHRDGESSWVVERIKELRERWSPCAIALDKAGGAGSLYDDLIAAGVDVQTPTAGEVAATSGDLYDRVAAHTFRHIGQASLSDAVAGAKWRNLADAKTWDRRTGDVVLSPLVSVTVALWARRKFGPAADYDVMDSFY